MWSLGPGGRDKDLFGRFQSSKGECVVAVKKKKKKSPLESVKSWPVGRLAALVHKVGGTRNARCVLSGQMRVRLEDSLVNGMFLRPYAQIAKWNHWLPMLRNWLGVSVRLDNLSDLSPTWSGNKLGAVVLVLRAPTAWQEFQLYWPLIAGQQTEAKKADELVFDAKHFDWHWHPLSKNEAGDWHFEWQHIDLGANVGLPANVVRTAVEGNCPLPNAGILAAAAIHDEWFRKMNGQSICYVNLSGYRFNHYVGALWKYVPYLFRNNGDNSIELAVSHVSQSLPNFGNPVFV